MSENKYYILTRLSSRGMGSNSDCALVTEENLHKIMSDEEIIRGLKECSTYDEVPDLIALPTDIPISAKNMHMENVIFRVHNQWGYERDIIVGDASFTRYFVDLSDYDGKLGYLLRDKTVYEFTSFDFKRTIENHFFLFYKAETLVQAERDKIEMLRSRHDTDMDVMISASEKTIKRFENLPKLNDEYYRHFYRQKYVEYRNVMAKIVEDEIKDDDVDHTLCAYHRCLMPDTFACEMLEDKDLPLFFRYDELFERGSDIKHLIADLVGKREDLDRFDDPQIDLALLTVFGYD